MSATDLRNLLPSRGDYADLPRTWRGDLLAGLTVGVVALPLALAFGVTSGLGADVGLITAIVAGIVAAVFGGSHVQVSGPTGAMTVVLVPVVAEFGFDGVLVVALFAGLLLILAGALRLGRYVSLLPWPLIEGFTVGIGLIIFLQQVPFALGIPKPEGENTAGVAARALTNGLTENPQAIAITVGVALLMIALPRLHRSLPSSLIAVIAATAVAELAGLDIPRIGLIPSSLPSPSLPSIDLQQMPDLVSAIVAVAALAAIESLLSAKVADGMADSGNHGPDRELVGQGLANVSVSFFGGMPATGAIARTAVNVRANGRTRVAAITHSIVLIVVVLALASVVSVVPLAALAGVLMVTAIRMVEFGTVGRIMRSTRRDAVVLVTTAAATVIFDLVVAVEVGIVVASILALRAVALSTAFEQQPTQAIDVDTATEHELIAEHIVTYSLDGALFFGAAQRFLLELADIADVEVVILRLGRLNVLDATGAQALGDIVEHLEHRGITVLLVSLKRQHRHVLEQIGVLDRLAHENHLLPDLDAGIEHARSHLRRARLTPA